MAPNTTWRSSVIRIDLDPHPERPRPWRIRCGCGVESVVVTGTKAVAVARSAQISGFKPTREVDGEQRYLCGRCFKKLAA